MERFAVDTFTGAGPNGNPDVVDEAFQSLKVLRNNPCEVGLVTVSFCTTGCDRILIKSNYTNLKQRLAR